MLPMVSHQTSKHHLVHPERRKKTDLTFIPKLNHNGVDFPATIRDLCI